MRTRISGIGWRDVAVVYPWVSTINKIAGRSGVRRLLGDAAYVFTDYSGQHAGSPFEVISVLIVDAASLRTWQALRSAVRQQYLRDSRRMSYKGMNDSRRRDALVPFLDAANALSGLCVTVAIDKRISDLCYGADFMEGISRLGLKLEARWKPKEFEKMLRIINLTAIFVAGVVRPGHTVHWVSDEDQIFANERYARDVSLILGKVSGMYIPFSMGELGLGTTKIDPGDRVEEDLAAIPDLIAGAVSDITGALYRSTDNSFMGTLAHLVSGIPTKTEIIADWLGFDRSPLQRLNLIFNTTLGGGYTLGKFDLSGS